MSFSQDKYLVLASLYGDIILWDLETFERSDEINIHDGQKICDLKECKINFRLRSCILTCSSDGKIKITSIRLEKERIATIAQFDLGRNNPVNQVAELRNYMIAASSLNRIYFWILDNCKIPLKIIETNTTPIYRLYTIDDGSFLLGVGSDAKLGVWKSKYQELLYQSSKLHNDCITDIIRVGDKIITVSLDNFIKINEIVYLFNDHEWIR